MTHWIEFQPTPNPNAGKFVVGRYVTPVGTSRSDLTDDDAADWADLAHRVTALLESRT